MSAVYQPGHGRFAVGDAEAVAELRRLAAIGPVTLVSRGTDGYRVTILPMLVADDGAGGLCLRGHVARGNDHWRDAVAPIDAVAIAQGPQAYIHPRWYPSKARTHREVPTWNYVSVVASGQLRAVDDPAWLAAHVAALADRHEAAFDDPWSADEMADGALAAQVRAVVGLELAVGTLEAKRKLSQNRSAEDAAGARDGLAGRSPMERAVADEMAREMEHDHRG